MAEEPTSTTRDSGPPVVLDYASSKGGLGRPAQRLKIMAGACIILSAVALLLPFAVFPMSMRFRLMAGGIVWMLLCVEFFIQIKHCPKPFRRKQAAVAGVGLLGMASILSLGAVFVPTGYR